MIKKKEDKRIYKLFMGDQKDHSAVMIETYKTKADWNKLTKRDKSRQYLALKILKEKKSLTCEDYFRLAMLFQHGTRIIDSKKAISLSKKGALLGSNDAKWLYAAAVDRLLIRQRRKQKFGTQYRKMEGGKWFLLPVDPKTTDKERAEYNVVPLKQAKAKAEKWNKSGLDPWQQKRKKAGITSTK